jgi:hypothetical protein
MRVPGEKPQARQPLGKALRDELVPERVRMPDIESHLCCRVARKARVDVNDDDSSGFRLPLYNGVEIVVSVRSG